MITPVFLLFNVIYCPAAALGRIGKKNDIDSTIEEVYDEFPFFSKIKKKIMIDEFVKKSPTKYNFDELGHNKRLFENFSYSLNKHKLHKKNAELGLGGDEIYLFGGTHFVGDEDALKLRFHEINVEVDLDLEGIPKVIVKEAVKKVQEAYDKLVIRYKREIFI